MNRAEFMRRLTELLGDVSPMEREEAIQYYNDYFDDAGEENEGSVLASLGSPEELARTIKAGLNDGGNGGEFTESGFSGYTRAPKDEVIRAEDAGTAGQSGNDTSWTGMEQSESTQSGNDYYEGAYYSQAGSRKESMSGGMIALIVIAAVLTSPVWIGLLGSLFGVAVGVIVTLFALFLSFLIVGVVLVAVAAALFVTGITVLFSMPAAALCLIGSSLALFALGLVFIWLMVLMVGVAIPACVRGIVSLSQKIFHRGGARA